MFIELPDKDPTFKPDLSRAIQKLEAISFEETTLS